MAGKGKDLEDGWNFVQKGIKKLINILEGKPESQFSFEYVYVMFYTLVRKEHQAKDFLSMIPIHFNDLHGKRKSSCDDTNPLGKQIKAFGRRSDDQARASHDNYWSFVHQSAVMFHKHVHNANVKWLLNVLYINRMNLGPELLF
ncbi:uncharacterized protein [Triticum aestivum]|uniref:uncharacterized protein n=1 Tax=Triticum aestivum TaxID=4565 RepID=UPI001D033250|nr:uncharacterized protein LOC123074147 [Triticum aestivum]